MNKRIAPIIGILLILVTGVTVAYFYATPSRKLPIYSPADVNPKLVDSSLQDITKMHRVSNFELTDQTGNSVTEQNFNNKIYVADFFFTTCEGICPKMTAQMQRVQNVFLANDKVKFISHSVTPEIDSVEILAEYGKKYEAEEDKWHLVTGSKKEIYELARKSYFAVTTEGSGDEEDFIHTENFVLIDSQKRIRGYYDGTSKEEVDQLIEDIKLLLKENNS